MTNADPLNPEKLGSKSCKQLIFISTNGSELISSRLYCHFAETDKYQTNYDGYYGQYADNAVSGETYDQANAASEFQQHLLKYVQQYQDKQDALSILDDPSAVSTNMFIQSKSKVEAIFASYLIYLCNI